jgi:hypothetical protein
MRLAADELLIIGDAPEVAERVVSDDPHAIVVDETGLCRRLADGRGGLEFLAQTCEWEVPKARPAFAQGWSPGCRSGSGWSPSGSSSSPRRPSRPI